ncbi:DnaJ C-terminal domain-containing protein [Rhizobium sp. L1K21]|uniref:DnaJ C-terminal domain-containing protein n=1 Tax=Rhizobium sp. L1K21 TaxID=2954933 RepID=UPI00209401AA|nr:DnaJ C-terminal domain-containing protein [Rhizobium sp. L1K21]MCO6186852.1 DnaJ domain-containing protein [Rhizobium sp. L1K21]
MRDPYAVLGVRRSAGPDEIKAAWRSLAKSLHPDRNQNDPEANTRFAEIGQAYQLLKDPERRYRYDMERRAAEERRKRSASEKPQQNQRANRPGGASERAAPDAASAAAGAFGNLFRKFTAPPPTEKAPDMAVDAWVTIEAIFKGESPQVTLPDGRSLRVPLPETVRDGALVRVPAQGHKIAGMQRGDVVATIRIRPHKLFRFSGSDLHVDLAVDIENAVLGCETIVDTPDGPMRITVPEWTGSNRTLPVRGKGLPKANGERGELYAEVRVMLWDHPDDKVKDLMRSMREGLFL